MAIKATHNKTTFGVGDRVRVVQKIEEGGKNRSQAFEGMVIGIKGRGVNKSFTLRKIGVGQIGIERIYPLSAPTIEEVRVVKVGLRGVRRAKLYYTRSKSKREIDKIHSRARKREEVKRRKRVTTKRKGGDESRAVRSKVNRNSATLRAQKKK